MSAASSGFFLGLSLIFAIGAQNVMVLRQGLLHQHVFLVCLICAISDALLIHVGVFGMSAIAEFAPSLATLMRYFGAIFLLLYALLRFRAAWLGGEALLVSGKTSSKKRIILIALALTWLNPHVYLDTVLLLGSVANQFSDQRMAFALGATLASFVFFFSLGYGARLLRPLLAQPRTWRIIEVIIGLFMLYIAFSLLVNNF
ncbi:LysE/ArgO family amino acid transporter [Suttonella sp. R2A3]|uniref:LysE/ArgO family amino acid transporter n=1 Tax=Suttonella sp. R2A3 TaxID=2908648 RepID=UPI0038FCFFD1